MRCLLLGHNWTRVDTGARAVDVCRHCYKRRRPPRPAPTRRTTTSRGEERGSADWVELLLWSALVGVVGGFLLFTYLVESGTIR